MIIRPAVHDDAPALAALHVRSWQLGYRGLISRQLLDSLDPAERVVRWQTQIAGADLPRTGVLVAEGGGRPVGLAGFAPSHDVIDGLPDDPVRVGLVNTLYVDPGHWRRGVGRALMDAVMTNLQSAGYAEATLWVLAGNERAIGFYSALGWRADGIGRDDVLGELTFHDLHYRKTFDPSCS